MSACNGNYPTTTIVAMRNGKASGCFELSHVGLVARTDSPSEPRVYVEDAGGGDMSAIATQCDASATHLCAPSVNAKILQLSDTMTDGAKISVRGYYQYGKTSGFEGFYIEDIIDECSTMPRPAPITLTVANLTRDARTPAKWFQRATIDISAQDPLVMYDFSPPELLLGDPQCPDYAGFAMIPRSSGATAPAGCNGKANPTPRSPVDPKEILVGRQFFNQFLFNADCACSDPNTRGLLTPTGSVSGPVLGYLIIETDKKSTAAYQVFEPAANKSFFIQ
jgi:hypothetical protein